jgi:hypothetical protein
MVAEMSLAHWMVLVVIPVLIVGGLIVGVIFATRSGKSGEGGSASKD